MRIVRQIRPPDDRFARPGQPKTSPSGDYTVSVDMGPVENGVKTWVAVIRDNKTGAEAFRDSYAYSSRHGVGITWLSTNDQLWLLSGDVGPAHVDRRPDGTWTKPASTRRQPATFPTKSAPIQIADRRCPQSATLVEPARFRVSKGAGRPLSAAVRALTTPSRNL